MKEFVKISIEKLKLLYQWITKILLAKSHFRVAPWTKLWLNLQGYLVDQYMIYDFKHTDKKEYLSEFDWYRSRRINGDYSFILNNKLVFSDIMQPHARVPETYAFKSKDIIFLSNGTIASDDCLLHCLKRKECAMLKPISCGKGKDVHLIQWKYGQFYLDLQSISIQKLLELLHKSKDWFLSEYVQQATYLNDIYAETANTIRLITMRNLETYAFEVFFAVQRIGTSHTIPVDNGSGGALISKIDLETGVLSEAKSLHNLNVYDIHPDSKKAIKGLVIPNWRQIRNDVLALSNGMPYLSFIAWDILVTDDGFCVIEANTSSGVNIIQLWGGQRNGALGNFYRAHGVIK